MKVIEHINRAKNPIFSFEIVPPPRGRSVKDIIDVVEKLVPLGPAWIDVTSHSARVYYSEASDGTIHKRTYKKRPGTIGICGIIQNRYKIDTVTHLLCHGVDKEETEDDLIEMNFLGLHNVFAIRGDGFTPDKNRNLNLYAEDLVKQIKDLKKGVYLDDLDDPRPLDFGVGVAAYPEKHFEAPNLKQDIDFLKRKVDAGADYITTQMFFDNKYYFNLVNKCQKIGITVPILPGIKVLKSSKQLRSIPRNFYIDFPDELVDELQESPKHAKEIGVNWGVKQCRELIDKGVKALHFFVMYDVDQVINVIKKL